MTATNWKEALSARIPEDRAHEIDIFEGQVELRRQNKLDEKVFAETRLRWGIYGQRYDNGQRFDGTPTQWPISCSATRIRRISGASSKRPFPAANSTPVA